MKKIDLNNLGSFIKHLREKRGMTQAEFAKALATSQSVVARIESGSQNLTTETLNKISEVLNNSILSMAPKSVDFEVVGGKELSGSVNTNTSKNGAMGILCASLLNKGTSTLYGIPKIEEVSRILEVLTSIGFKAVHKDDGALVLTRPKVINLNTINVDSANRTRSIIMFLGALVHEFSEFKLPHSQGCTLGSRTINPHMVGLSKFGVEVEIAIDSYNISSPIPTQKTYPDITIIMPEASDTGTELLLIAAAKYPGKTTIKYAPSNYMVQDVCLFIKEMGVQVEGIGTHILTIHGKKEIKKDLTFYNSEDPIESMMFLTVGICTNSEITVKRCPIDFLEIEIYKLGVMGAKFSQSKVYLSKNGHTKLVDVTVHKRAKGEKLVSTTDKISCGAYPDLNIDNLPFFVPVCALAEGRSLIHDWVYENRAIYFTELNRLGANISLADPHRVFINGVDKFTPAQVVCPPALRPAMIILIAMMCANGVSVLRNVYSIKRGYEDIANRLNELGADIKVI
jgi:UDP-N-acetylglucosamine 1-carboxyvinyltransferase